MTVNASLTVRITVDQIPTNENERMALEYNITSDIESKLNSADYSAYDLPDIDTVHVELAGKTEQVSLVS